MPTGSPDSWAPDFALAQKRLKPRWIIEWMQNPQGLLPGTKMPTYVDPQNFSASGPEDILNGDEEKQIKVLSAYLLTLSNSSPNPEQPKTQAPMPAPAVPEKSEQLPVPDQSPSK